MHLKHQEHPKGGLLCNWEEMLKLNNSLGLPRCHGVEGLGIVFFRVEFSNLGDLWFVVANTGFAIQENLFSEHELVFERLLGPMLSTWRIAVFDYWLIHILTELTAELVVTFFSSAVFSQLGIDPKSSEMSMKSEGGSIFIKNFLRGHCACMWLGNCFKSNHLLVII